MPRSSFPHGWVLQWTSAFALAAVMLCGISQCMDANYFEHAGVGPQWVVRAVHILFTSASMLTLSGPNPAPDGTWLYPAAQLASVLFVGFGGYAVAMTLFGDLVTETQRRIVTRRSQRHHEQTLSPSPADPATEALTRPHVVVVGLGTVGWQLVQDLRRDGVAPDANPCDVIVVESDPENPNLDHARALGAVVLIGDARDPGIRARASLDLADEAFIVCGDDALCVAIAGEIVRDAHPETPAARPWATASGPLTCYVHLDDPTSAKTFRDRDLLYKGVSDRVRFRAFSARELAVDDLLFGDAVGDRGMGHGRLPKTSSLIVGDVGPEPGEAPHYVLIGFDEIGQTVAVALASLAHFQTGLDGPDHRSVTKGRSGWRPRVTVLDAFGDDFRSGPRAGSLQSFIAQRPGVAPEPGTLDLAAHAEADETDEWGVHKDAWASKRYRPEHRRSPDPRAVEYAANMEFLDLPAHVEDPAFVRRLVERFRPDQSPRPRPAIVVCFDDDRANLEAALALQDALASVPQSDLWAIGETPDKRPLPIYVYLHNGLGFADLLARRERALRAGDTRTAAAVQWERFPLRVFGLRHTCAGYDAVTGRGIRQKAQALHRIYRAAAATTAAAGVQVDFHDLEATFRESNEHAVRHAAVKRIAFGRLLGDRDVAFEPAQVGALRRAHSGAPPPTEATDGTPNDETLCLEAFRALDDLLGEGTDADVLAAMEHNRWMGERLSRGWFYEALEDNPGREKRLRQRQTFVPWEHLPNEPDEREYDRRSVAQAVQAWADEAAAALPDR